MADKSSWLRFLPPILWEREPQAPDFSLGASLRIFEKILTGIDDGLVIGHDTHTHDAIQAVIARLHRLYDPWHTPPDYLRWLAGWVALEFSDLWDEYQQRKITSEIVEIYQQRGLKRGLEDYLDLYTVADKRPRITIDDSAKLLITKPVLERVPDVTSLNAQVPMIRPFAICRGPDGSLFMADPGQALLDDEEVWRLFPEGHYQVAGAPALPVPIGPPPPAFNLEFPVGVTTDTGQVNYNVYVLDRRSSPSTAVEIIWRLTAPAFSAATAVAHRLDFTGPQFFPIAITFDPANGHLLVLSGGGPSNAPTRVYELDVSVTPPVVTPTPIPQVVRALSFTRLANGNLVIGDGGNQATATPGDLWLIDRSVGPWTVTSLLATMPAGTNPLVSPSAIVEEAPGRLLVADVGLKPFIPDLANPFMMKIARQAGLYRVELSGPTVVPAAEGKQLVWPSGLVLAPDGTLFISDRGEAANTIMSGPVDREWRALHQEFGVTVYFPDSPATTKQERQRVVHDVRQIISREKPAHANWSFLFRV